LPEEAAAKLSGNPAFWTLQSRFSAAVEQIDRL
jgi:hypothetical protein